MIKAFLLATAMALASAGAVAAQSSGTEPPSSPGSSVVDDPYAGFSKIVEPAPWLNDPVVADAAEQAYGRGDYAEALRLWRIAAEQGDTDAQHNLGFMYGTGQGVPQNKVEAYKWWACPSSEHLAQLAV